ncbi:unnamed protein product, partial [Heterosigma akashiwo]
MMGDGAKNVKGQKLLNFLIATNKGTLFLFSEDTEGEHITADYMAAKFIRAIELVGPENVAALVTDNAGEMRASFQIIKERFPHLIFLGCAAHLLDRCLRDLLQIDWIQDLVDSSKQVVTFIKTHSRIKFIFEDLATTNAPDVRKVKFLTKPATKTRFAGVHKMLYRLHKNIVHVQNTIHDPRYIEHNVRSVQVENTINSRAYWNRVETAVNLMDPMVTLLRLCDSDKGENIGKIYPGFKALMNEHLAEFRCTGIGQIKTLFRDRLRMNQVEGAAAPARGGRQAAPRNVVSLCNYYDIFKASYCVEPEFQLVGLSADERAAFERVLDIMEPQEEARANVLRQFDAFRSGEGGFANPNVMMMKEQYKENPCKWWKNYGIRGGDLATVAVRMLSIRPSQSNAERNWKHHSWMHNVKRNRLDSERVSDLVQVHNYLLMTADNDSDQ